MVVKFRSTNNASGILFSWRDNSSYRLYTLGPLCLWQCFIFRAIHQSTKKLSRKEDRDPIRIDQIEESIIFFRNDCCSLQDWQDYHPRVKLVVYRPGAAVAHASHPWHLLLYTCTAPIYRCRKQILREFKASHRKKRRQP